VFDNSAQTILQVGNLTNAKPVTRYNVRDIFTTGVKPDSAWQPLIADPFMFSSRLDISLNGERTDPSDILIIPFMCPLYNPENSAVIGTVFLGATTAVITDKLAGYSLPGNSELYFTIGGVYYRIENKSLIPSDIPYQTGVRNQDPLSRDTAALMIRDAEGRRRILVSYPLGEGIALTQLMADIYFFPREGAWPGVAAGLCVLILFLAFIVTLSMDHSISRPVARLRKRIDALSRGDFSLDPVIESDTEIGQVGKGVNRMAQEITALLDRRIADEKNKRDLEYRMLQSQINPHFLYNTLNSIKWMAAIQHVQGIVEMTTALSRLLQTLSKDSRRVAPLRDELALLDEYLVIQKYRYGGSVTLVKHIDDESLLDALIPRFSLQPLLENAIFHGIEPKGSGTVRVEVSRCGKDALISITDNGIGMNREVIEKIFSSSCEESGLLRKLGIRNVDERLRYAFGEDYGLSIESEEGKFTSMIFRLPLPEMGIEDGTPVRSGEIV
jgi:two-component system sensor histidine kinase YesM